LSEKLQETNARTQKQLSGQAKSEAGRYIGMEAMSILSFRCIGEQGQPLQEPKSQQRTLGCLTPVEARKSRF
jgi:hypothetical protein